MALAGIGVDMVEIARMEKVIARRPRFVTRIFTEDERRYCERMNKPAKHYASRFAAREAVLKALGTGFSRGIGPQDVSVVRNEAGRPEVVLTGRALEVAREQGIREVALSLSYTHDIAIANAVAITDDVRPKPMEKPDPTAELRASFRAARSVLDELERGGIDDDFVDDPDDEGLSETEAEDVATAGDEGPFGMAHDEIPAGTQGSLQVNAQTNTQENASTNASEGE